MKFFGTLLLVLSCQIANAKIITVNLTNEISPQELWRGQANITMEQSGSLVPTTSRTIRQRSSIVEVTLPSLELENNVVKVLIPLQFYHGGSYVEAHYDRVISAATLGLPPMDYLVESPTFSRRACQIDRLIFNINTDVVYTEENYNYIAQNTRIVSDLVDCPNSL